MKGKSLRPVIDFRCGIRLLWLAFTVSVVLCLPQTGGAVDAGTVSDAVSREAWEDDLLFDEVGVVDEVADPLESMNRMFFIFNDKVYFWVAKPLATGYSWFLPEEFRVCLRNGFTNLKMPVRVVNTLLQGKFRATGTELARFFINTTMGIFGLGDPAKEEFDLPPYEEDFGQTMGVYGAGEGMYLCLPFLGPSNLRDVVGLVGDYPLDPLRYADVEYSAKISATQFVNNMSLKIGDYEKFKEAAFDPYVAMRDSYHQYRQGKIAE